VAYHLVTHESPCLNAQELKVRKVITAFLKGLTHNFKFFSETDIIQQWIIKMAIANKRFKHLLGNSEEGAKLVTEMSKCLEIHKSPSH
jgi:hypothetical protein